MNIVRIEDSDLAIDDHSFLVESPDERSMEIDHLEAEVWYFFRVRESKGYPSRGRYWNMIAAQEGRTRSVWLLEVPKR